MSKEREMLKKILATGGLNNELSCEIEELLAQPEHIPDVGNMVEPVAWMYEWVNEIGQHVKSVVYNFYDDANLIPLYTSPQVPEPLSDEAIRAIVNQLPTEVNLDTGIEFCKIIEKAHGIGGGE